MSEMITTENNEFIHLNGYKVADEKSRKAINELAESVNGLGLAVAYDEPTERLDIMMNGSQEIISLNGETTETDEYDAEKEALTIY